MHMEKINDNEIRCTLTSKDLSDRSLSLRDMKYGDPAVSRLFQDICKEASVRFGFNPEGHALMIEAVPMGADELVVTISSVDEVEELDPHYARFISAPEEKHLHTPFRPEPEPFLPTGDAVHADDVSVIRLQGIDRVTELCHTICRIFSGKSLLYREEESHCFLLVLLRGDLDGREFNKVLNTVSEYAVPEENSRILYARLKEYETPVMTDPLIRLGLK